MSLSRVLSVGFNVISNKKHALLARVPNFHLKNIALNQERDFRKAYGRFLKTMKARGKLAGPGPVLKRSEWIEWNYNAELYAFNKRLKENISEDVLRCIFIHDSYVQSEKQSRKDLEVADVSLDLKSNSSLVSSGCHIMSDFIKPYLRHSYEMMPEDGIRAVHDYLLSDDVLSYISTHIGTKDLIFCAEYPPSSKTLADTIKAVVGAIASSDSVTKAQCFILDFVCTHLIGKDVFELWEVDNPLEVLNGILLKEGHEPSESRLIFESGRNTIEAIYNVGLYSEKKFLGKGFGETLAFSEEMAAYDALRRIFRLNESDKPLPLGDIGKKLEIKSVDEHKSLDEIAGNDIIIAKNLSSV